MVRRRYGDARARHDEPKLMGGWDMDRFPMDPDTGEELVEDTPSWEDVERVRDLLERKERIVLRLARDGKTLTDLADIMRMRSRFEAREVLQRAVEVARFLVKWEPELRRLKSGPVQGLNARELKAVRLMVYHRRGRREVAAKLGCTPEAVDALSRRAEAKVPQELGALLRASREMRKLRPHRDKRGYRRSDMEAWRTQVKNLLMDNVGKVWYDWGGQAPFKPEKMVADCSGLAIEALKLVGVLPSGFQDRKAAALAAYFVTTAKKPLPGDLAFYGRSSARINHVMIHVGEVSLGGGRVAADAVAGMCGGRRKMSSTEARLVGAGLWVRRSARYRGDYLFTRRVK